jgi:hypothetical protein
VLHSLSSLWVGPLCSVTFFMCLGEKLEWLSGYMVLGICLASRQGNEMLES